MSAADTTTPPAAEPTEPAASGLAASDRPILAFFDVDNTLMRGASIFQLGREAVAQRIIGWRDIWRFVWHQFRFKRVGENLKHLASVRERGLGLIAGHTQQEIRNLAVGLWGRRIKPRLYPGTVELTQEHLHKGHEVWLLSATPLEVGELMADRLGLTGALGTVAEVVGGVYTGALVGHVLHGEHKAEAAGELAERAGADVADCWAYSDSSNDLPLLELVGHPVVVNPDAILLQHAQQHGWPVMRLSTKSLRAQRKRVKREARAVRKSARRQRPEA